MVVVRIVMGARWCEGKDCLEERGNGWVQMSVRVDYTDERGEEGGGLCTRGPHAGGVRGNGTLQWEGGGSLRFVGKGWPVRWLEREARYGSPREPESLHASPSMFGDETEIRPRSLRFVNMSFPERLIPVLHVLTFLLKFRGCDVTSLYSRVMTRMSICH